MYIGTVIVRLVYAKGLREADYKKSDSYCIITFPNDKKIQTDVKENNCNPIWKKKYSQKISINKKEYKKMKFVDVKKCFKNPGKWIINKIYKLTGDLKIK